MTHIEALQTLRRELYLMWGLLQLMSPNLQEALSKAELETIRCELLSIEKHLYSATDAVRRLQDDPAA
jgi:hypothetical protein